MLFSFLKWINVKPRTLERPSPYYRLVSYVVAGYDAARHQPNCNLLGSSSGPTFTGVNTLAALASLFPLNSLTVITRYCEQTPPSTGRVCPVTYRASSDKSHTTASAISSGWPIRPIGTKEA